MGSILYSVFLSLYKTGVFIASLFSEKARKFRHGRKNWQEQLQEINPDGKPLFWMHCASLGEFEQGRPLLEAFKSEYPDYITLLTFFSPSGYEIHKNSDLASHIRYLPLDSPSNAEKWLDATSPTIAVFVKYEFWYYYTRELARRNIPLLSVSSIFRKNQSFFKFYGGFNRKILHNFTHFFVQDSESETLLSAIGLHNVTVAGDSRFDRVCNLSRQAREFPKILQFCANRNIFIIGSAWPDDMDLLYEFINSEQDLSFIIAPHEINESFISTIEKRCRRPVSRYSSLEPQHDAEILIIDNVGMLSSIYRHAKYAWIGGAFGHGLHNILEAAVYGIPVFFGNRNYRKFREAVLLEKNGGAFPVGSAAEFLQVFNRVSSPANYQEVISTNKRIVQENLGATEKIMAYCRQLTGHERVST